MQRLCLVLLVVGLTACDKKPESENPTGPTAAVPARSADKSSDAASRVADRQPAVCKAYQKQRSGVKAQLSKQRTDLTLMTQDTALAVIIADACR
jgi:hypothetical protein